MDMTLVSSNIVDDSGDLSYINLNYGGTSSPRLLNVVEPYIINGIAKTMFYSEVNTGFEVGDRVFILNGEYDSDKKIKGGKYKRGGDGYRVLYIDRCAIVLDINYTGNLPHTGEQLSSDDYFKYIKIFNIKNNDDFATAISDYVLDGGSYKSKYENTNNYIYISSPVSGQNGYFGYISSAPPGKFYKMVAGVWVEVLLDVSIINPNNNGKFILTNGSIVHNGKEYREEITYIFSDGEWIPAPETDVNSVVLITKSNFRKGFFSGKFNGGIYGSNSDRIDWMGDDSSEWNSGTLFNTTWNNGVFNSYYSQEQSYIADINESGLPYQRITTPDNEGYGYNFIINSELKNYILNNGNISNSYLEEGAIDNIVLSHLMGDTSEPNFIEDNFGSNFVGKSVFDNCSINNSYINNSLIKNSRIFNTMVENSKSINSRYTKSVFRNSNYLSDNTIKILKVENLQSENINGFTYRIIKLFINKRSFIRFRCGDVFYLKGVISNDESNIINFFDRKFVLSKKNLYIDELENDSVAIKRKIEGGCFLNHSNISSEGYNYSIDIILPSNITVEAVDIESAYILNSDFADGIFENSVWNSGYNFTYTSDSSINNDNNSLEFDISANNELVIKPNTLNDESYGDIYKNDSVIFMKGISYRREIIDPLDNTITYNDTPLPDTYIINNISNNRLYLKEFVLDGDSDIIPTLTGGYLYFEHRNRYTYINTTLFKNSSIKGGIIKGGYFKNCFINNESYNVNDIDFIDKKAIKELIITDTLLIDTKDEDRNIFGKSLYHNIIKSSDNDIWANGIFYNSTWLRGKFDNGLFKTSSWMNGVFNDGLFYDSRSYDYEYFTSPSVSNKNNINSLYLNGTFPNNRYSWRNGIFNGGVFRDSSFESGEFIGGELFSSEMYHGDIRGGSFGRIDTMDTYVYSGIIYDVVVKNADFISRGLNGLNINWKNGRFNSGRIGTDTEGIGQVIWENGVFNNGNVIGNTIWMNGVFNGGKFNSNANYNNFRSAYINNRIDTTLSNTMYNWIDGVFNGGEFGSMDTSTNINGNTIYDNKTTWYNGTFNGGLFMGKVWYNGTFSGGEFVGSLQRHQITNEYETEIYDFNPIIKYRNPDNFNGLWYYGICTNLYNNSDDETDKFTRFYNVLWIGGEFNHTDGIMSDCIWMDGVFRNGTFENGVFNPFNNINPIQRFQLSVDNVNVFGLDRGNLQLLYNSGYNFEDSCVWYQGTFIEGIFSISDWHNGNFISGRSFGMHFIDGVVRYMDSYNMFWENGVWENGNWNGSYIKIPKNGTISELKSVQILKRGADLRGDTDAHLWNVFRTTPISTSVDYDFGGSYDIL